MRLVPRNTEQNIHEFSIEVNELLGKFVSQIFEKYEWSLTCPYWGNQTMQMYGVVLSDLSIIVHCLGLVIL